MHGKSSKFRIVEENKPPMIMVAIGPIISEPGLSLLNAIGDMASAVTSAVIKIEGKRSWAASVIVSKLQCFPSCSQEGFR